MTEIRLTPSPSPSDDRGDDLAAQATMYRLMVENTIDVIIRYDASRQRIYVSPSSREMFGYEPTELITSRRSAIIHPDDFPLVDPLFKQVGPARTNLHLTFRMQRKDGTYIWVEGRYRYLPEDGGSLAVMRDITARKQAEDLLAEANQRLELANQMLRTLAHQDGLTGLLNRRRFDELLAEEFNRARRQAWPLSVLLLDVDCFKAYNDRYGHVAGDECLGKISRAIESVLRRPGEHAARYGGEEFVVLLPATDHQGAVIEAERIRAAVSAMKIEHLGGVSGMVSVSVGSSSLIHVTNEDLPINLITAADCALYQAKSAGRNRVVAASMPCPAQFGGVKQPTATLPLSG